MTYEQAYQQAVEHHRRASRFHALMPWSVAAMTDLIRARIAREDAGRALVAATMGWGGVARFTKALLSPPEPVKAR